MTGAALPFVLTGYILAAALILTGVRRGEWANAVAGIVVFACLTAALTA